MRSKKTFLLLLITFLYFESFSQNIEEYYKQTNKAENKICQNKLREALCIYEKSFFYNEAPFTHDLYNAFVCSVKLGNAKYELYQKIRQRGVSLNFFKLNLIEYSNLIDSLEHFQVIKSTIDKNYRDTLNEMLRFDQLYRGEKGGYEKYSDTIKKVNERNGIALLKLIKEKGFPSEAIIGNDSNTIILNPFYSLIFHHAKGAHFQSVNFSAILEKAINEGKLDNRLGTTLIDFSNGTEKYGNMRTGIIFYYYEGTEKKDSIANWAQGTSHKWYMEPVTKKEITTINKNRKESYLDNVNDYRKKIKFYLSHPEYNFCLYSYKSIFGMAIKEEYDYIMNYLKEVK